MHAFLPYAEMKCCNLLFDIDVLYPYLSWMTTFYSVFSCTVHKPTIFWPNPAFPMYWPIFYFFFVPTLIFFFCIAVSLPHFILFPVCSPSLSLSFPKCPFPSLSYPFIFLVPLFIPCSIPYVHASVLEQMFGLTCPTNRLEPWSMTTSPFCGTTSRYGWSGSSPLFLDSSLLVLRCLLFSF